MDNPSSSLPTSPSAVRRVNRPQSCQVGEVRLEIAVVRAAGARPAKLTEPTFHVLQTIERLRERCRRATIVEA